MRQAPRRTASRGASGEALLAAARFGVPPAAALHVRRPRLSAALAQAEQVPLVLVSAPAGTGKTAAVADWVREGMAGETEWITFEEGDAAFWVPVLSSLRRHGIDVPISWLSTSARRLGNQRLDALAGLVAGGADRLTVVVDGYELAELELGREVDYLLRHNLGRLRLVFVGRTDPVLPLYRYRLSDSLAELRAPDLAFSDDEAATLLRLAGVRLSGTSVHQLNDRVKGWAAGLRFAARVLAGHVNPQAQLATVLGQTTDMNEYLVGEVLNAQAPDVRRFLLTACVTEEVSAELVEVLDGPRAARTMEGLVDRREFIEPVPDRPGSFRFYPFFRDFLRAELAYESPDRMAQLGRTAARWLRAQGRPTESLSQLAMIGAWQELASQIVDDGLVGPLILDEHEGALSKLARKVPADVADPAACVVRAAVAVREGSGGMQRCAQELEHARAAGHQKRPGGALGASAAVVDALRGCFTERDAVAAELAAEAQSLLDEGTGVSGVPGVGELARAAALARGVSALRLGRHADAVSALADAIPDQNAVTGTAQGATCLGLLALSDAVQGLLASASRRAEESLTAIAESGLDTPDVAPCAHVAMAWVGVERADADTVRHHVTQATVPRRRDTHPFCTGLLEASIATLELDEPHPSSAVASLTSAAAAATLNDPWLADFLRVEAARIHLWKGRPEDALRILEGIQDADMPEAWVTMAAAYTELGDLATAAGFGGRVDPARAGLSTHVRAVLTEAAQMSVKRSPAHAAPALSKALRLAAREQIRRPFREAGPSVRRLLAAQPDVMRRHAWLRQVGGKPEPGSRTRDPQKGLSFVQPLTVKELEVLGHAAELLTTEEIAQKMFLSVNTVRTHIRNILRKLEVDRRNAAIRRARELGILES